MVQRGLFSVAFLAACLSLGSACIGGEADMMKILMEKVNALEAKNAELERRANATQSTNAAVDAAISKEEATAANVTSSRCITIGGYFDTSFQYNFNEPRNLNNNLRAFDTDANGYNIHLAELTFDALPTKAGEAGFRLDLVYGTDARLIKSQDKVASQLAKNFEYIDSDFKQAYIEYIMPIGCGCDRGIKMDAGKFVTWAGFETIEAQDNFNSSRSFLFTYAIPFTHTGTRATYDVFNCEANKWTVGAAAFNGWDNTQDQNRSKSYALYSNWRHSKWFEMSNTVIAGREKSIDNRTLFLTATDPFNGGDPTDPATPGYNALHTGDTLLGTLDSGRTQRLFRTIDNRSPRYLLDTSIIVKPFCDDYLVLAVNGDFAHESGGKWYGIAGYAKWQFAKKWSLAFRAEYFNDANGVRTGIRQALKEGTVTLDWALTDQLHSRLEFRQDRSNKGVFDDGHHSQADINGNLNEPFNKHFQNTIMYSWLYKF